MPRIVVTRKPPGRALEMLDEVGDVWLWEENRPIPHPVLLEEAGTAEAIYSMLTDRIDDEVMGAAHRLRVVSNMAVGVDNVDLDAAARRGIAVGHTPDVLTETTADMAFALLLAAARRFGEAVDHVREGRWGEWEPSLLLGRDVHATTLGIVGMGRIGRAVARRAAGFDMEVVSHSRRGGVPLDELLATADHVVLCAELNADTRGMIDERRLRSMKPTAVLVNVARGPLVDSDALVRALREGWIFAAGLDVTDPEPIPPDHPLVSQPNCLVVPHVGSATERTRAAMAELAARNAIAGLRGEPLPARVV